MPPQTSRTGGGDADIFLFSSAIDIGGGGSGLPNDVVEDFNDAQDKLDLRPIDAYPGGGTSNDAFLYLGSAPFSSSPGVAHLRAFQDAGAHRTYIEGDLDGDGNADFRLELVGPPHIHHARRPCQSADLGPPAASLRVHRHSVRRCQRPAVGAYRHEHAVFGIENGAVIGFTAD
jgi:hypothetical protein